MTLKPSPRPDKLGLIVGGGALPRTLANICRRTERPYVVLRLRGFADAEIAEHPGVEIGLGELGRALEVLKQEGCKAVCFVGDVKRPDFSKLKPDLRGLKSLPGIAAAALKGDDALLRYLLGEFEKEGFRVEGAQDIGIETLPFGPLGRHRPGPEHEQDIALAVRIAKTIGALDVGQAVATARGVVLAVEAQEGTDALLQRCRTLPADLIGDAEHRVGVLCKWPKPIQERRIDLPTLGAATVFGAARAGLAGIVGEAGGALLIGREDLIEAADRLGLFVVGLEPGA